MPALGDVYCEAQLAPLLLEKYMLVPLAYQNSANTFEKLYSVPVPGKVTTAQLAPPLVEVNAAD